MDCTVPASPIVAISCSSSTRGGGVTAGNAGGSDVRGEGEGARWATGSGGESSGRVVARRSLRGGVASRVRRTRGGEARLGGAGSAVSAGGAFSPRQKLPKCSSSQVWLGHGGDLRPGGQGRSDGQDIGSSPRSSGVKPTVTDGRSRLGPRSFRSRERHAAGSARARVNGAPITMVPTNPPSPRRIAQSMPNMVCPRLPLDR